MAYDYSTSCLKSSVIILFQFYTIIPAVHEIQQISGFTSCLDAIINLLLCCLKIALYLTQVALYNMLKQQQIKSLRHVFQKSINLKKIRKENSTSPVYYQPQPWSSKHQRKGERKHYCQYCVGSLNFMHCDFNNFSISHLTSIKVASFKSGETTFHALQFH